MGMYWKMMSQITNGTERSKRYRCSYRRALNGFFLGVKADEFKVDRFTVD
jgi:hypothetical protein